jgi:spore coat polysaccharide biosynthesis protein SpsF (cytidylyltransferase family)
MACLDPLRALLLDSRPKFGVISEVATAREGSAVDMFDAIGIIEVRQDEKNLSRKLGGKAILERVVRRVTDCERLRKVIVLCGDSQLSCVHQLVPADVEVIATRDSDSRSAVLAICKQSSANAVVHVWGKNPFVDPELIDRLLITAETNPNCDYIGYCGSDGRPAVLTHKGMLAEWCSVKALWRASCNADHLHFTASLYAHPEQFRVRLIPLPMALDRKDLRLRLDAEEDWDHAHILVEALGHDEWDWRQVVDLLADQPALRRRMAHLNQTRQCI